MVTNGDSGLRQYRTRRASIELGLDFQGVFGDRITALYREITLAPDIVSALELCLDEDYKEYPKRALAGGIHHAVKGHTGGYGIDPYVGLLSEEEIERLAPLHRQKTTSRAAYARAITKGFVPWCSVTSTGVELDEREYLRGKSVDPGFRRMYGSRDLPHYGKLASAADVLYRQGVTDNKLLRKSNDVRRLLKRGSENV